jgi:predicted dehydrogenase
MANGVEGAIQQSAGAWGPSASMVRVAGSHGTLWLEGTAVWVADARGARELPVPAEVELPPPPAPSADPRERFSTYELGPYIRLAEVLRAAVDGREAKTVAPAPTFADGVAAMVVLDAIRASARADGALVQVPAA